MHRVCWVCGIEYGEKSPKDDRITHGLCRRCLPNELRRIKKELSALKTVSTYSEQKNTYSGAGI
jgi:hypothetical protein